MWIKKGKTVREKIWVKKPCEIFSLPQHAVTLRVLQENFIESTGPVLSFTVQLPQAAVRCGDPVAQPGKFWFQWYISWLIHTPSCPWRTSEKGKQLKSAYCSYRPFWFSSFHSTKPEFVEVTELQSPLSVNACNLGKWSCANLNSPHTFASSFRS